MYGGDVERFIKYYIHVGAELCLNTLSEMAYTFIFVEISLSVGGWIFMHFYWEDETISGK